MGCDGVGEAEVGLWGFGLLGMGILLFDTFGTRLAKITKQHSEINGGGGVKSKKTRKKENPRQRRGRHKEDNVKTNLLLSVRLQILVVRGDYNPIKLKSL